MGGEAGRRCGTNELWIENYHPQPHDDEADDDDDDDEGADEDDDDGGVDNDDQITD